MTEEKSQPVIVILGHIDHGKSTLLDYIRKTAIAESEAGGITQAISAYETKHQGRVITFIDTPGHESFKTMRQQGAAAADLAVLVVSAEDGVKPQTLEAKEVLEQSRLPYLVAINKIDTAAANLEQTKQSLAENGIYLEGQGGEIPWTAISAKTGAGVDELLDLIIVAADLALLKTKEAPTETAAEGYILESRLDPKQGIIAAAVVRRGALRRGDYLTSGGDQRTSNCFRIKKLENFRGQSEEVFSAGRPAGILGWKTAPGAGTHWQTTRDKTAAENLIKNLPVAETVKTNVLAEPEETAATEIIIPLIIKTGTVGALAAAKQEIAELSRQFHPDEAGTGVKIKILDAAVGAVGENDLQLAAAAKTAIVVGFQVKIDKAAKALADKYRISCQTFEVIYQLKEWLATEAARRQPVREEEIVIGTAKIIKLFSQTKNKQIVGALATDGKIKTKHQGRIKRRDSVIGQGEILELREWQTKVDEVAKGRQFGALIESRYKLAVGDLLEILEREKK